VDGAGLVELDTAMGRCGEVERAAAGGGKNGNATGTADGNGEVKRLTWDEFSTAFNVFRYVHCNYPLQSTIRKRRREMITGW
jgi:hypothetical protein